MSKKKGNIYALTKSFNSSRTKPLTLQHLCHVRMQKEAQEFLISAEFIGCSARKSCLWHSMFLTWPLVAHPGISVHTFTVAQQATWFEVWWDHLNIPWDTPNTKTWHFLEEKCFFPWPACCRAHSPQHRKPQTVERMSLRVIPYCAIPIYILSSEHPTGAQKPPTKFIPK